MALNLVSVHHIHVIAESYAVIMAEQVKVKLLFGLFLMLKLRLHFLPLRIRLNSCLGIQKFARNLNWMSR